jgi:hypothetical protein
MALTCDEIAERVIADRARIDGSSIKDAFSRHYKAERDRSEKCLGNIIEIMVGNEADHDKLKAIAKAMVEHYSRS